MIAAENAYRPLRSLDTPRPHPALVHPPLDPELIALQLGCLGERSVVARRGTLEVRVLRGPLELELRLEIGRLREQRARLAGRGTGRPADLDDVELRSTHVVVWCTERRAIAAAACIVDAATDLPRTHRADGRHDGRSGTIEVARCFVAVGFGESDAAVALLRGIDAWITIQDTRLAAAE